MTTGPIAVVDVGSNSIKVLVAARDAAGKLHALGMKTLDARISTGISRAEPRLGEEGMQQGLNAVRELLAFASAHQPEQVVIVATSAVRDAQNGADFRDRILAATGHEVRVLSGEEEANLIARGLTADPLLHALHNFYVFDLGGGSLECLAFQDRRIQQARSFPLGCVRLAELLLDDPAAPFLDRETTAVAHHVERTLQGGDFRFDLPDAAAVFAGGSMTATRLILAAEVNTTLEATSSVVPVVDLQRLLSRIGPLRLPERQRVPGLPPARADVYPTALATMLTVAERAGVSAFQHSFYNLRWGVADENLSPPA